MPTNEQQPQIDDSNLNTAFDATRFNLGTESANKRGVISGFVVSNAGDSAKVETEAAPTVVEEQQESPELEEVPEEEEQVTEDSPFATQFKETFGIEPTEAVELVNSLQAFRDEQTLMRQWSVDPVAYDDRMSQVREFYKTLPEQGREQFNTVEGAVAIWNHLVENNKAKVTKPPKTPSTTRVKRQPQQPTYDYKRSEIKRMPKEDYQRNLPSIVRAFQTGRVLED